MTLKGERLNLRIPGELRSKMNEHIGDGKEADNASDFIRKSIEDYLKKLQGVKA